MTDLKNFDGAFAHLQAALALLDGLGMHAPAADVCQAIERMKLSELGAARELDRLSPVKDQPTRQ